MYSEPKMQILRPSTADAPPNFADDVDAARNRVSAVLRRVEDLSRRLVGERPEAGENGHVEPVAEGLLAAVRADANAIVSMAIRIDLLLDRIDEALPQS